MRDLAGIAEINGPNHAALAAERAANITRATANSKNTSALHGNRLAARREINNTPFRTTTAERTLADRTADQRAAGFVPGRGTVTTRADLKAAGAFKNTPEYLGMEGIECAIDQKPGSPFMEFWLELNEQRGTEVRYGEARALFNGGPTPAGALTFVEKGDGFRAIPAPPVESKEAWYGEYREITGKGTKWHRVTNQAGDPIVYTTPTYALSAAVWAKGNAIQRAFH